MYHYNNNMYMKIIHRFCTLSFQTTKNSDWHTLFQILFPIVQVHLSSLETI